MRRSWRLSRPRPGEGFVAGDVVNTASRLQGAAPVNGLCRLRARYRATARVFEWEQLEPVQVKGKAERLASFGGHSRHGRAWVAT